MGVGAGVGVASIVALLADEQKNPVKILPITKTTMTPTINASKTRHSSDFQVIRKARIPKRIAASQLRLRQVVSVSFPLIVPLL